MDVALRLDRPLGHRLRADPAERARHGAFPGLVGAAETQAEIEAAMALFIAAPAGRQRLLAGAFENMRRIAARAGITPDEVEAGPAAWKSERAPR